MHIIRILAAVVTAGLALTAWAQGSDPNLGRNLAATCANCHGTNGVSVSDVPSLAGAPRANTVNRMRLYKEGKLPATIMHQIAKGYTDDQIELVAAWFAAQKPAK